MTIRDRDGKQIRVGDAVRVVGVPDLSRMSRSARDESEPVFRHILGSYKRVAAFNQIGWVELEFAIRRGKHKGLHSVWIEPTLLKRRQSRT